jgi:signal transduction histidine kinase/phage shock protein PspC (stress-responsive transcriptional regulator)
MGGVSTGLAVRFGLSVVAVRISLVLLALAVGPPVVVAYFVAWAMLPADDGPGSPAGGVGSIRAARPGSAAEAVAGAAVVVGAVLVLAEFSDWLPRSVLVPALLACAGAALVWGGRIGDRGSTGAASRMRPLRVALGVTLVVAGGVAMLATMSDVRTIGRSLAGAAVVVAGIALMLGPGLARLARNLGDERRQRILSEERADVAAHLHDGVLQTLALIQKRAGDDKEVRSLARRQERELRDWLYGGPDLSEPDGVAGLLRRELADVEDRYGVRLDAVLVGDAPLDEAARALVAAGREAARNAATHAGVDTVDVYLEVEPERVSLYVRDRGAGFDPAAVPADRRGLADSVLGRVRRHGGVAEVRSVPGEGTEIELSVPRSASETSGTPRAPGTSGTPRAPGRSQENK